MKFGAILVAVAVALFGTTSAVKIVPQKFAAATGKRDTDLSERLEIIAAVYGKNDVTEKVRAHHATGAKTLTINDATLGDGWPGNSKSFGLVFKVCHPSKIVTVQEHQSITVPNGVRINGAVYGGMDVTEKLRGMYDKGQRTFLGGNEVWGDPWFGTFKSFSIIYNICEEKVVAAKQGATINYP